MARKMYPSSVIQIGEGNGPAAAGLMVNAAEPAHLAEKMEVLFALEVPDDKLKDLESAVASGKVMSPADLRAGYSPPQSDVDTLTSWLKQQGFQITRVSADRTSVDARADVTTIEKSLQVHMARVTREGVTYTAAVDVPSLPEEIAGSVHDIHGLQPFRHMNKHYRTVPAKNRMPAACRKAVSATATVAPSPNVQNAPPYLVSEILGAYNANNLHVDGTGQTIAILIDTTPDPNDLQMFWQKNNLNVHPGQVQTVNVTGANLPPPEGEETLDVSWSSGVAPGATIRVYATGSLQFVDLDKALDAIIADVPNIPGMRQLSISLGLGETFLGTPPNPGIPVGEVKTQHAKYLRLAALGVNVFVSSGDAGSSPDASGHSPTGPTQAEYSSSDSAVIGVGGTSLTLTPAGGVASETGWVSGGGGRSIFFARPPWQVGVAGAPAGQDRLVPDVSLVADPNTGAFLVLQGQPTQIGGTSWSAPVWAGFCALINHARSNLAKPPIGFLNPLIYPLIGTACFRDITQGSNGDFDAGNGYDMVTGLGVPDVAELIASLS